MKKNILLLFTIFTLASYSHGGGLDSNGGHWDRKRGTYHQHRSSYNPISSNRYRKSNSSNSSFFWGLLFGGGAIAIFFNGKK